MKSTKSWGYCAKPKTAEGCACSKSWEYQGTKASFCANPDNDPGGSWCNVEDESCQGKTWGYCKKPCGDSCKNVRQLLEKTRKTIEKIGFEYDGSTDAYAYVRTKGNKFEDAFQVPSVDGLEEKYTLTKNGDKYVVKKATLASDYVGDRAIMTLAPAWWKLCNGDLETCKSQNPDNYGTLIGTVIH